MKVTIEGLTIRQRNALVKAFEEGLINQLLNERYMSDIFSGDQIHILPEIHRQGTGHLHDTEILYLRKN